MEEIAPTTQSTPATKRCPYCAEEILADAVKCKHCGEWLNRSATPATPAEAAKPVYSQYQETGDLVLLCLASFFLYEVYWEYRNWKYVREYRKLDISPFWRTVGSCIPVVSLFIDFSLFTHIRDFGKVERAKTYKSPGLLIFFMTILHAAYWMLFFIEKTTSRGGIIVLARLSEICTSITALFILATVQNSLNNIWKKKEANLPIRQRHTDGEIAVMIVGILLWILWLVTLIRDVAEHSY